MEGRLEWRRREFMQGVDLEFVRKQREDFSVEIRKQNRQLQASKRRLLSQDSPEGKSATSKSQDWLPSQLVNDIPLLASCSNNRQRLIILKEQLAISKDLWLTQRILRAIRASTASNSDRPMAELVQLGYLPGLIALSQSEDSVVAGEATWIVSNIASDTTEFTTAVVESGAMDASIALLTSPILEVQEHSIWTLGNVAGDSPTFRDLLLRKGVHQILIGFLKTLTLQYHAKVLRVSAWTLCNLVRGKPTVPISVAVAVLDALPAAFLHKDKELRLNLMYILENLSQSGIEVCDQIIAQGFLDKTIRSIRSKRKKMTICALKICGAIAAGTEEHTQQLLRRNILDSLMHAIPSTDSTIRNNVLWILSNIAAGSRQQLGKLLDHNIILVAVSLLVDPCEKVRLEASYLLYNAVMIGNSKHYRMLEKAGVCSHLHGALLYNGAEYVINVLTLIEALLKVGEGDARELEDGINPAVTVLDSYECIDLLQKKCSHGNERVRKKAESIYHQYFEHINELEVEMQEPPATFSFS